MNLNETNPALRRMFLTIYADDGVTLSTTAAVAPPVGALQVSIDGAAFVNAGGTLVHIGAGSYYYEATAGEVATAGFLAFKFARTGYRTEIDWATVGRPFLVGEVTSTLLRLPLTIYDTSSPAVLATGATVTAPSDLQVSVNGAAYADSAGSLHEVGSGLYYYQAVAANVATAGIIVVKYVHAGFGTALSWTSIDPQPTSLPTASLASSTPPGQLDADPDLARWVPVQVSFTAPAGFTASITAQIGADSALWMQAYDESLSGASGNDALAPLFADKSSVQITGAFPASRSIVASILPNGGWQRPDVKIVPRIDLELT